MIHDIGFSCQFPSVALTNQGHVINSVLDGLGMLDIVEVIKEVECFETVQIVVS